MKHDDRSLSNTHFPISETPVKNVVVGSSNNCAPSTPLVQDSFARVARTRGFPPCWDRSSPASRTDGGAVLVVSHARSVAIAPVIISPLNSYHFLSREQCPNSSRSSTQARRLTGTCQLKRKTPVSRTDCMLCCREGKVFAGETEIILH